MNEIKNYNSKQLKAFIDSHGGKSNAALHSGMSVRNFYYTCKKIFERDANYEVKKEDATSSLEQLKRDIKRIKRKERRHKDRENNANDTLNREIAKILNNYHFSSPNSTHVSTTRDGDNIGVIHLSDIHFGECVYLAHNSYNFEIASKRLKKLVTEAKRIFTTYGVNKVLIAFTGDLMNSDRRADEILLNATNRAKTLSIAVDLLQQVIRDVASEFQVYVASVCGNESRLDKDWGSSQATTSNNFDYMIFQMLRNLLRKEKIGFMVDSDPVEHLVKIGETNILMLHGVSINKDVNSSINAIKAKYMNLGVKLDFIIFGHIHQAFISDEFARSGSLVGDNDYSNKTLNLSGRASQNLYVFSNKGDKHAFKIDLQLFNDVIGYDFEEILNENKNIQDLHIDNITF